MRFKIGQRVRIVDNGRIAERDKHYIGTETVVIGPAIDSTEMIWPIASSPRTAMYDCLLPIDDDPNYKKFMEKITDDNTRTIHS